MTLVYYKTVVSKVNATQRDAGFLVSTIMAVLNLEGLIVCRMRAPAGPELLSASQNFASLRSHNVSPNNTMTESLLQRDPH